MTPADAPALATFMRVHYPPAYGYLWSDDCAWYLENQYSVGPRQGVLAKAEVEAYWLQDGEGVTLG